MEVELAVMKICGIKLKVIANMFIKLCEENQAVLTAETPVYNQFLTRNVSDHSNTLNLIIVLI